MSTTRSCCPREPATDPAGPALLLCAHGSGGGPGSAQRHAAALRRTGLFRRVEACCLNGRPTLAEALATVGDGPALVLPMVMANGCTARRIAEALAAGPGGGRARLLAPLGTHPLLAPLVAERAAAACGEADWPVGSTALLLIAHGSLRDPASAAATDALAVRLGASPFATVVTAFLEQPPGIADAVERLRGIPVVAVGLFADEGRHGAADVRRLLAGCAARIRYTGPIGCDPRMATLALARACTAMAGGEHRPEDATRAVARIGESLTA